MDPITLAMLGLGGASFIGGLFGRDTSNPNQQFGDINSPFYQQAQQNYFSNLRNSLNASSPGTEQLLAMQMSRGADYGGSSYIANKQRENIMKQNTESAIQGSNQFLGNLFGRGLDTYAQGNMARYQDQNSFANSLLGLGGGLIGRYLSQSNMNSNINDNFNNYMFGLNSYQQGYLDNFQPTLLGIK